MGKRKRRLNSPKFAKKYATVRAAIAKARGFFEEIISPAKQESVEVAVEKPAPVPVVAEALTAEPVIATPEPVVAEVKKPTKKKATRKPRKTTAKKKTTKKQ